MNCSFDSDIPVHARWTYSYNKLSCWDMMYTIHMVFTLLLTFIGAACLITRVWARHLHPWFGRGYIALMTLSLSTAMLINNTGLPIAVLISFAVVVAGMLFGWLAVLLWKKGASQILDETWDQKMEEARRDNKIEAQQVRRRVQGAYIINLSANAGLNKWKCLHGALMFISWFNIAMRTWTMRLDPSRKGDCFTYPFYKPVACYAPGCVNNTWVSVPLDDPNYPTMPWVVTGLAIWAMCVNCGLPLVIAGAAWYFNLSGILQRCWSMPGRVHLIRSIIRAIMIAILLLAVAGTVFAAWPAIKAAVW
jgi:hypothetical protein